MAGYLKPRRGKKSTAIRQNIILKKGEVFFEAPDAGVGKGAGKIKMGDGVTSYENLPYFLNPAEADVAVSDISNSKVTFDTSDRLALGKSNAIYLNTLNDNSTMAELMAAIRGLEFNNKDYINYILEALKETPVETIRGTTSNPVIIQNLEEKVYFVSGVVYFLEDKSEVLKSGGSPMSRLTSSGSTGLNSSVLFCQQVTDDNVIFTMFGLLSAKPVQYTLSISSKSLYITDDLATTNQILSKTNTQPYTPAEDYHPATKKYVDNTAPRFVKFSFNNIEVPANDVAARLALYGTDINKYESEGYSFITGIITTCIPISDGINARFNFNVNSGGTVTLHVYNSTSNAQNVSISGYYVFGKAE